MMTYELDSWASGRLESFLTGIGRHLRDHRKRASFAMYALGLLTEGERKSVEPMATRMCGGEVDDPVVVERAHQKLLHFISESKWDDHAVRAEAVRYPLEMLTAQGQTIEACIIDDTGFLKQGKKSPGVQRQYSGSAGKTANCQIGVSVTVCSRNQQFPVDMELYLPERWIADRARCEAAKIPDSETYRPKWKMALDMLARAQAAHIPLGIALADSAYGNVAEFRAGLTQLGLDYAVGVNSTTRVCRVFERNKREGPAMSVKELARSLPTRSFRTVIWRHGTKGPMSSRFAMLRVRVLHSDGGYRAPQTLLIEWPRDDKEPTDFTLVRMRRQRTLHATIGIVKQRWRTERVYQNLKGELGLDHFEGRSFLGWHHHVSVALCCYAFVVGEQLRHSPPCRRPTKNRSVQVAA